jgi:hypothetical protein
MDCSVASLAQGMLTPCSSPLREIVTETETWLVSRCQNTTSAQSALLSCLDMFFSLKSLLNLTGLPPFDDDEIVNGQKTAR